MKCDECSNNSVCVLKWKNQECEDLTTCRGYTKIKEYGFVAWFNRFAKNVSDTVFGEDPSWPY